MQLSGTFPGPSFAHGGAQPSINIGVIHDVEAPMSPGMAESLIGPNYFGHGGDPGNPVSIHYLVGPDGIYAGTPENTIAWHVGNGNSGTIGIEQLGFASWSRAQWLSNGDAQITNLAVLMRDISSRRPLIQLRWLTDAELVFAWHNKSTPGGWTTHAQMTRVGLGSTHTDPGTGYPTDVLMSRAQNNETEPFTMAQYDDIMAALGRIEKKVNDTQLRVRGTDDANPQPPFVDHDILQHIASHVDPNWGNEH